MAVAAPPRVLAALADETRWSILVRLGSSPASASALAHELPVSRQAIGKHLEMLRSVGLVESARSGREVRFHALAAPLRSAAVDLERLALEWDDQLGLLKAAAEAD